MLPVLVLMGVCSLTGHGSRHSDADNSMWSVRWETSNCNVEWSANGDVTYTDDGTDVAKLPPGVKLTVLEAWGDHSRRVVFTENSGMVDRQYKVNGMMHDWDAGASKWFAAMLVELDHETGKLAPIRFKQLMAAGGPAAVLEDMQNATGSSRA